ncbi:DegT/DnrJ/EryC1/StrS aminotransferase family protein [bacterium]|nr:DegT/DnrJ/EryC1/StrS aminotransferase family protein [bacterium]
MTNTSFPLWPCYSTKEADIVREVLLSNKVNYWTGGHGKLFEKEFAAYTSSNHAIALANGTLALDLALLALDVGPGDDVIVTPRTYFASVSSIVTIGANPIFCDVNLDSQNISLQSIKNVYTPETKVIILVHLAGMPVDMDPIITFAKSKNLKIIEDCAQAHGAKYKGRSVGSLGDIGTWSFCQDKIMTTGGEGGMVTCNDQKLWEFMWSYKDHGKSYDKVFNKNHPVGFRWLHDRFGSNFRMTEIQAAIGRHQLQCMPNWTKIRQQNSVIYNDFLEQFACVRIAEVNTDVFFHACYKHYVFLRPKELKTGWTQDRIVQEISSLGLPCYHGSCAEVYMESAFNDTNWRPKNRLHNAKLLGETSLMFLVHPSIQESDMDFAKSVLYKVFSQACK